MKNKNIILTITATITLSLIFVITITSIQNKNLNHFIETYKNNYADQRQEEAGISKMEAEDKEQLAIAISNRDCDLIDLEVMAEELGYNNLTEACLVLTKEKYLVYIPPYTTIDGHTDNGGYTRPDTVRADNARQYGIID